MSLVFIISAPSGSGKSTLVNEIRNSVDRLDFSVSYTTRKPRGSETNGREYYYIDRDEFERMIEQGAFLEYADVFGNYYGTARHFLREAELKGYDLLLDIDVQGASQLQRNLPQAISIFILPPSKQELEKRLRNRSAAENVPNEIIQRRLRTASHEIEKYEKYDYILVNANLEDSARQLRAIILSERLRVSGKRTFTPEEQKVFHLADQCRLAAMRDSIQSIIATFTPESSSVAK